MSNDDSMHEILRRLRQLGPDWHEKLAKEMLEGERDSLREALIRVTSKKPASEEA